MPVQLIDALIDAGGDRPDGGVATTRATATPGSRRCWPRAGSARSICSFPRQSDSWVFDGLYRRARSSSRSCRRATSPSACARRARASGRSSAPRASARCSARARRRARSTGACRSSSTRSAATSRSSAPTSPIGWATCLPQDGAQLRAGHGHRGPHDDRAGRPHRRDRRRSTRRRSSHRRSSSTESSRWEARHEPDQERDGRRRRPRHPRRARTSTSASASPPRSPSTSTRLGHRPAHRERHARHGPRGGRRRDRPRPHQRGQDPGHRAAWRVVLPPRRLLRDDARRAPRRVRPRRLPGLGPRRPRQLAHRRSRTPSRPSAARWTWRSAPSGCS